jgi:hypothetical protein
LPPRASGRRLANERGPHDSRPALFVFFLHSFQHPVTNFFYTQPFVYDRDADGNDVFDEPGGTTLSNAVQNPLGPPPSDHVQSYAIDASGRCIASIESFRALLTDTCRGAPPGCAFRVEALDQRVDGSTGTGVDTVHLSASGRYAAMMTQDALMFGTDPTIFGNFGVVRDTCLGQGAACIPATHEVTVRQSDGGRGGASSRWIATSQDGTLAVTGVRRDLFPSLPDMNDLFLALTGFPQELGGAPVVLGRSPGSASAGASPLLVTIKEKGFVPGSVVWRSNVLAGATPLDTTFVSRERVQVLLDFNDLATPQVIQLQVKNPGGAQAGTISFVVN